MKKRILSLVTALALCLGLMPAPALAAGGDETPDYAISLSTYSLNLGASSCNVDGPKQTVTITNTGNQPIKLSLEFVGDQAFNIDTAPNFPSRNNPDSPDLQPGEKTSVTIGLHGPRSEATCSLDVKFQYHDGYTADPEGWKTLSVTATPTHSYDAWMTSGSDSHSHKCQNCYRMETEPHTFGADGKCTACGAQEVDPLTITGGTAGTDYTYTDGVLTVLTTTPLTIQNTDPDVSTNDRIYVASGVDADITLAGVNISAGEWLAAFEVADSSSGNVTVTLAEGTKNVLTSGRNRAGLQKNDNAGTLTIRGEGSLTATGGDAGAGIGGGYGGLGNSIGNIIIKGGTVTATGNDGGAGIGGGQRGSANGITIEGGTVIATGSGNGAGIGGGQSGSANGITITGGTVTATSSGNGAAIGSGSGNIADDITITGGAVTATATGSGAAIGGSQGNRGDVTISGGTVTATATGGGAGVGAGANYSGSSCTFSTGDNGAAFLVASSITDNDDTSDWSGVIFQGNEGRVYGNITLPAGEYPVPEGSSLTIPYGASLGGDGTLTGSGTFLTENVTEDMIDLPEDLVYDGTDLTETFQAQIKAAGIPICGKNFTVTGWTPAVEKASGSDLNYHVTYTYNADRTVTFSKTIHVAPRPLSWDVSGLWAAKKYDGKTDPATVSGSLGLSGVIAGDEVELTYTGLTAPVFATADPHSEEVALTVTGAQLTGEKAGNYILPTEGPAITATINKVEETPVRPPELPADTDDKQFKVEMETGLSEAPGELENIEKLDTPAKIEFALKTEITKENAAIPEENTAVYDVALMVKESGGEWRKADAAHFPKGGLTVTLPYPAGTNSSYKFTVVHMFTTTALGQKAGDTETPAVANTADGIRFTVNGLSPISVGWTEPQPSSSGSGGGGGGSSAYVVSVEDTTHGTVKTDRSRASSGTTVTITVTPDEGYQLDELTVTDSRGSKLALTDKGSGKFTFRMPSGKVTVEAVFTAIAAGHDCPSLDFTDLDITAWYHEAVDYALENDMMSGYGSGVFGPNNSLSRAMLCQILYNLEDRPATGQSVFDDVANTAWYADAVTWANANGIVSGYGDGRFGPNDAITREQLATILWRYAQFKGYDTTQGGMAIREFSDYESISDYAVDAMTWAVNTGVVGGYEDKTLRPRNGATRAQVAQMLMNFLKIE